MVCLRGSSPYTSTIRCHNYFIYKVLRFFNTHKRQPKDNRFKILCFFTANCWSLLSFIDYTIFEPMYNVCLLMYFRVIGKVFLMRTLGMGKVFLIWSRLIGTRFPKYCLRVLIGYQQGVYRVLIDLPRYKYKCL